MRFNVGMKLAVGFASVIGTFLLIGIIILFNFLQVQHQVLSIEKIWLAEFKEAENLIEKSLWLRYHVRGLGMDGREEFAKAAREVLPQIRDSIGRLKDLAERYRELSYRLSDVREIEDLQKRYEAEIDNTEANNRARKTSQEEMGRLAEDLVKSLRNYVQDQTAKLENEINTNAAAQALRRRNDKITWANDLMSLYTEVRVANYRSQVTKQPEILQKAVADFQQAYSLIQNLRRLTTQRYNIEQLDLVEQNARRYIEEVQRTQSLLQEAERVRVSREAVGNSLLEKVAILSNQASQNIARESEISIALANQSLFLLVIGFALAIVLGAVFATLLTRSITRPLVQVAQLSKLVSAGDLEVDMPKVNSRDEIADLIASFDEMIGAIRTKARALEKIANGDLRDEIHLASDRDGLGLSLRAMQNALNEILRQVNNAVVQIAAGSDQVSQASQNLSQGATEQAASLEEISASTTEVSSQARQNAESATTASRMARGAAQNVQQGQQRMIQLREVMDKINREGQETKKIVKAIDDIAFQVNLLALNANVEAARAGKYGKGFAVVAEEVRALAVRSAQAVKETTALIEGTLSSIDAGARGVKDTAEQFAVITTEIGKIADLLEEIAAASQEQAKGMTQISTGLEQVDQVTQSNTASAEQTASAAEELSGQAQQLKVMVSRFQLKGQGTQDSGPLLLSRQSVASGKSAGIRPVSDSPAGDSPPKLQKPKPVINLDDGDFSNF